MALSFILPVCGSWPPKAQVEDIGFSGFLEKNDFSDRTILPFPGKFKKGQVLAGF
jgi:hypothetical protein